jgi:hypothetical protein
MNEVPSTAFDLDPDLVAAFRAGKLDVEECARLADQVSRVLPFSRELPNPLATSLVRVAERVGGDEALLRWLDGFPGRPRLTARLFWVIGVLDRYSAADGVLGALGELRARDPFPHGLEGHLVPDTASYTLASLGEEIEELLGRDRLADAGNLALRALALLSDIAPRAAELDRHAADLGPTVRSLCDRLRPLVEPDRPVGTVTPNHLDDGGHAG